MAQTITLNVQYSDGGAEASLKNIDQLAQKLSGKKVTIGVDSSSYKEANQAQQEYAEGQENVAKGTKEVTKQTGLLGDSLGNVAAKMLAWQVMGRLISAPLRAITNSVKELKEVDTQLVTIRKVTGATVEEAKDLADTAYEVGAKLGAAASEYLDAVAQFAKAGYADRAEDLGELAIITAKVGDTTQETANQFLLSVDKAYQFSGSIEELTRVLDGANEIGNRFATDVEHIAQGLGIIAPVAAQAHVGINELTAAVGTITAVTQRSGSEAARALRALFLNIMGDTKTEIEEGAKWTAGEIEGLRDVLNLYAHDVVEAADASGELIDPMEAIAALAQSMKDGLLTEQRLMEMVSDIGGKLRTSQLLALIQNWDMYQEMLTTYAESAGSAAEEYSIYLDSWEAKTKQLDATWTKFMADIVDTDVIKGLIDGLKGLIEILDTTPGKIALIVTGVLALNGAFAALKTTTTGSAFLSGFVAPFTALWASIKAGEGVVASFTAVWNASPFVVITAIAAAVYGIVKLIDAVIVTSEEALEQYKDLQKEADEAAEKVEETNKQLDETARRMDELLLKDSLTFVEEQELDNLKQVTKELEAELQLYKDIAAEKEKAANQKKQESFDKLMAGEIVTEGNLGGLFGQQDMGVGNAVDYLSQLYSGEKSAFGVTQEDAENALRSIYAFIDKTYEGVEAAEALKEAILDLLYPTETAAPKLAGLGEDTKKAFLDAAEAGELTAEEAKRLAFLFPEVALVMNETGLSAQGVADYFNALAVASDKTSKAADTLVVAEKSVTEILDLVKTKTDAITKAAKDMESQNYLSVDSIQALINAGLQEYLVEVEDGYVLAEGALEDYMQGQRREYEVALSEAESAAKNVINQEQLKANGYDATTMSIYDQIKAMQKLAQANMAMAASQYRSSVSIDYGTGEVIKSGATAAAKAAYSEAERAYDTILGVVNSLETAQNNLNTLDRVMGTISRSASGAGRSVGGAGRSASTAGNQFETAANQLSSAADQIQSAADQADQAWRSLSSIVSTVLSDYKEKLDEQKDAIDAQIDSIEAVRDAQVQAIQDQIDAMNAEKEAKEDALEVEEKRLAVEKARQDLLNAQNERTVRYYNAATGQWEWMANQNNVKSAQQALEDAEQALRDTINKQAFEAQKELLEQQKEAIKAQYQAQIDMLEAQKKAIDAQYDAYQKEWKAIQRSVEDPLKDLGSVIAQLSGSSVPGMASAVNSVSSLLSQLGVNISQYMTSMSTSAYGMGYGMGYGMDAMGYASGMLGSSTGTATETAAASSGSSYPGYYLKKGMTDDYVKQIQGALGVSQTGYFGSKTYSAVKQYQRQNGLQTDGIVGPQTWGSLFGNYDGGGIAIGKGLMLKDTDAPELVLSPEMTRKILSPASSTEYANAAMGGIIKPMMTYTGAGSISTHDGATYNFGNIVLTDDQASRLTVKQLAQMSGALRVYGNPR